MSSKRTADWYARCLAEPATAHAEWQDHGVAVLPLGARFEAVRIPDAVAYVATESAEDRVVDIALALALEGPVIHDSRGRNYYALVEPGAAERWRARSAVECLGYGTHLGVPDMGQDRAAPNRPIYWAATPGPGEYFCRIAAVQLLVRIGAARLAEAVQKEHDSAAHSGLVREVTAHG
ncbi:hypothetical protein OG264_25870 [Streptomyces xanthophaeus]|uniref:hypothetical protein n=1 Tax=Streptomyces xanthophaeus TaxID=67385 RepID=UPI00386FC2ED|nr:hypothetical protein OG264_25870 [Streptomyces xanthophaeus]WST60399.1 hypothetical protein OG605_12575 [Streptomyces xanthophaeus]